MFTACIAFAKFIKTKQNTERLIVTFENVKNKQNKQIVNARNAHFNSNDVVYNTARETDAMRDAAKQHAIERAMLTLNITALTFVD